MLFQTETIILSTDVQFVVTKSRLVQSPSITGRGCRIIGLTVECTPHPPPGHLHDMATALGNGLGDYTCPIPLDLCIRSVVCAPGNGYITTQVLREILAALDDALKPEDLDGMIAEIDTDGSGTVDFDGNSAIISEYFKVKTRKSGLRTWKNI